MADYEFKFKNTNVAKPKKEVEKIEEVKEIVKENKEEVKKKYKSKNPSFVWSNPKEKTYGTLDGKIESFLKDCKENGKVKTEFMNKREELKQDLRETKNRKSKE
ncbi:MAG TPA: hypothetical protein VIK26_00565 [Clostridium sp.]